MNLLDLVAKLSFDDSEFKDGVSNVESSASKMGKVIGGVVGAGAILKLGKDAISTGMDFDSAMSQVASTMGLSQEEMQQTGGAFEQLRNKALEMGRSTKFSSTESANALNFLAMAGLTTEQSMALLPKVLTGAGASGMELATTSDKLTNIMSAMGLASKDTSILMSNADRVIDTLALTSTKANTDVAGLFESLSTVGSTAKMMKDPIGELSIATGILADNDIQASEAGTHLRNIIMSLGTPTDQGAEALKKLNVSAWEADGSFRPLQDILVDLNSELDGMSQKEKMDIISKIFNKTDISAVNALLDNSTDRWGELEKALEGAEGSAQKMYDTQNNNLKGAMTELSSATEGLYIALSDKLVPAIEPVVNGLTWLAQEITKVISGSNEANPLLKALAGVLISVGTAFAVIKGIGIAMTFLSLIQTLWSALKMVKSFSGAWAILNLVMSTNPIVLIIGAIAGLAAGFIYLWNTCDGFRNFWIWLWNVIVEFCSNAFTVIINFFTQTVPNAINTMIQFFSNLPSNIFNYLNEVIIVVGEWAVGMWNKFLEMCGNILNTVVQWAVDLWNKFVEMCSNILNSVIEFLTNLPYNFGYFLGEVIGTVVRWGIELWNKFIETCTNVINTVVEFFSQLPGKIWEFLTAVIHKVIEWKNNIVTKAREVGSEFIENIVNFFVQLPGKIWNFLTAVVQKVIQWRNDMVNKAKEAGSKFIEGVVIFFTQLPGKIWNLLTQVIQKAGEFARNLKSKASEAGRWFLNTLIEILSSIPGKMMSIGRNIVEGVWNGIKSMASTFMSNVKNFFGGIVDGVKSALGIHSPSRVMRDEVGKWIPAGVGVGIEKEMPALREQLEEEMNELTNVKFTPKIDPTSELVNSINGMIQRNIEVVFNVDGREFNRQVVAPYQSEVDRYNQVRRIR